MPRRNFKQQKEKAGKLFVCFVLEELCVLCLFAFITQDWCDTEDAQTVAKSAESFNWGKFWIMLSCSLGLVAHYHQRALTRHLWTLKKKLMERAAETSRGHPKEVKAQVALNYNPLLLLKTRTTELMTKSSQRKPQGAGDVRDQKGKKRIAGEIGSHSKVIFHLSLNGLKWVINSLLG